MDDVTGGHHTASLLMAMANKPSPHTGMPNEPPQHMMPSMGYGHGLASNTIMVPSLGMGGMPPLRCITDTGITREYPPPALCSADARRTATTAATPETTWAHCTSAPHAITFFTATASATPSARAPSASRCAAVARLSKERSHIRGLTNVSASAAR